MNEIATIGGAGSIAALFLVWLRWLHSRLRDGRIEITGETGRDLLNKIDKLGAQVAELKTAIEVRDRELAIEREHNRDLLRKLLGVTGDD